MDINKLILYITIDESFSTILFKIKDFLISTTDRVVNPVTDAKNIAINSVYDMEEVAKYSFNEIVERVAFATNKAIDNVTTTASQAKDSLAETIKTTTGKNVSNLSDTASHAGDYIKDSVEHTLQKADGLTSAVSTQVDKAIASSLNSQLDAINAWINSHPIISSAIKTIAWGINHPIFSIILLILAMFILWQLVKTFARLLEQGLLSILKFPFKVINFVFGASLKPLAKVGDSKIKINQTEANVPALNSFISADIDKNGQERLTTILTRLEAIAQEQNNLLEEVKAILRSSKHPG